MIKKSNILFRRVMYALLLTHCSLFTAMAQDKPEPYLDASLVSHYMWRGQDLGNVCFQPEIGIQWKGLDLCVEGSTGFTRNEFEEVDIHLNYRYKGFNIGVSDMWVEDAPDYRYFSYDSRYECKYGSLTWHTIFAGNDFKVNGDRAYSSFVELAVPFKFFDLDWDFRLGVCPYESSGATISIDSEDDLGNPITESYTAYFYAGGFGVNMVSLRATKNFPLSQKFKLPVFVEIHANPAAENARILMGISLATF